MARPITSVPRNKLMTEGAERNIIPAVSTAKLAIKVNSKPIRRAILGASGDRIAKAIRGKELSIPVVVLDKLTWERIASNNGPNPVMEARRLAARSKIPSTSNTDITVDRSDGICSVFSMQNYTSFHNISKVN